MIIKQEDTIRRDGREQSIHCLYRNLGEKELLYPAKILHFHKYIEFLYGLEGKGEVAVGDRYYPMGPSDLIIVNAGEAHEVAHRGGVCRYFVVKFLPQLLYSQGQSLSVLRYLLPLWQKDLLFSPVIPAEEIRAEGIDRLFSEIMREYEKKEVGYELILQADIIQIFTKILRKHCPDPPQSTAVVHPQLRRQLEEVVRLAQTRYADLTATEAADFCNLSYSYFSRSFKRFFGISFSSYLENLRLLKAEQMLLTGDADISTIAGETGFNTTSYFIACFKKHYGMAPGSFRKQVLGPDTEQER